MQKFISRLQIAFFALLFSALISLPAQACRFHDGTGLMQVPNLPNVMFAISNIQTARSEQQLIQPTKPDAMLNWQLAQKLNATMPVDSITFYQALEGHYSVVTNNQFRWLNNYPEDKKPQLGELMILSELDVFHNIIDGHISVAQALEEKWIVVNGPRQQKNAVIDWLHNL